MILKIANSENKSVQDVLAADIGATKTNIAVCHWDGSSLSLSREASYKTKSFNDIISLITVFIGSDEMPAKISLAVAGPVEKNKVSLTNINWQINVEQVAKEFNRQVFLINDLEAVAYSLAVLSEKDIHVLHHGENTSDANAAIIAPGTGLGEAGLYYSKDGYHPFATEGGHSSFSPRTETDIELYRYLAKKFEHVSWERLVSGPGISAIYDFLIHVKEREEPSWIKEKILQHDKSIVISENMTECAVCKETMDMYIRYLAEESGNLVLKLKAFAGVFIGGGIVPDLVAAMHEDYFLKQFSNFGRFKKLLQSVPVNIILNKKAPLIGAAFFGIQQ
jgi:glucokinase